MFQPVRLLGFIQTILEAVKLARKVIKTKPLSDIVLKDFLPGESISSDADLINYSKKMIKTNWHPVGTCKMGKDSDEMAVLNNKLQVRGIKNLRIFDVSMMPTIVAANTNAPAMAIADKATDMLTNWLIIYYSIIDKFVRKVPKIYYLLQLVNNSY